MSRSRGASGSWLRDGVLVEAETRVPAGVLAVAYPKGAGRVLLACRSLTHQGINIVASAYTSVTQADLAVQADLMRADSQAPPGAFVIPDLLSCLVLSWSERRAHMLQAAAGEESWQAKVCGDVQEFLRSVFQLDVPLTIIDLPRKGTASYAELREIAAQTCGLNRSLLVVCGAADGGVADNGEEERWARQLGAWAYLPGATDLSGLRLVFAEARKALAKQSSAYLSTNPIEASGCW